jgi:hypothetical protein
MSTNSSIISALAQSIPQTQTQTDGIILGGVALGLSAISFWIVAAKTAAVKYLLSRLSGSTATFWSFFHKEASHTHDAVQAQDIVLVPVGPETLPEPEPEALPHAVPKAEPMTIEKVQQMIKPNAAQS